MSDIVYKPIGIIHTPFHEQKDTPIQPRRGKGIEGTIEIFPEFQEALSDLDGFSHIILLFHFHRSDGYKLKVVPYLDDKLRGLFATRAPRRPNQIGLSIVRLDKIMGNVLYIRDIDMLDVTPLLDIKPYVPQFDDDAEYRLGWLEGKAGRVDNTDADDRFAE